MIDANTFFRWTVAALIAWMLCGVGNIVMAWAINPHEPMRLPRKFYEAAIMLGPIGLIVGLWIIFSPRGPQQ